MWFLSYMMKTGIKSVITLCVLSLLSLAVSAQVLVRERFTHYSIEPDSVEQIKLELRRKSPVSKENQLFHGGTQWKLIPKFGLQRVGNLCQISDIQVSLDGIFTLPKMTNRTTASETIQRTFDSYYASLLEHERGHQDLWLQAGQEIERALKTMPPHFQCEQLKRQATNRVSEIVEHYQQQNKLYDTSTGHGKTQGVYIGNPPK